MRMSFAFETLRRAPHGALCEAPRLHIAKRGRWPRRISRGNSDMSIPSYILEAAELIREFSPATAQAFLTQPFRRIQLAQAFAGGFARHSDYSRRVCALVTKSAELDKAEREGAALAEKARHAAREERKARAALRSALRASRPLGQA